MTDVEYEYAVYIGRFQPFHNGHLSVVKHGLEIAKKVIVIVGSARSPQTVKNPFSFETRKEMIRNSLHARGTVAELRRLEILPLRDYYYLEDTWLADVQAKTDALIPSGASVALLGAWRDASSYYLKSFPQWTFEQCKDSSEMSGTMIREFLFDQPQLRSDWEGKASTDLDIVEIAPDVPPPVWEYLKGWVRSPAYMALVKEYLFLQDYRQQWASSPYPPMFVTTDAVVTCAGHVLVVKRGRNPGKGMYALPGGFLKSNERLLDGAVRELKEETGIRVAMPILRSSIVNSHVFDHPDRSLRGRTITHAFHIRLPDAELPEVKGADDADEAKWMPFWDVFRTEEEWFEDHVHIVNYFVGAQGER